MEQNKIKGIDIRTILFFLSAALFLFIAFYFFSTLVAYLVIAFILSLIGRPIVFILERTFRLSRTLASIITIVGFITLLLFAMVKIIPLIAYQAEAISSIDFASITKELETMMPGMQEKLWSLGIIPEHQTITESLQSSINGMLQDVKYGSLFSNIFDAAGAFFTGIFSVFFISFFLLRDQNLLYKTFMLLIPDDMEEKAQNIIANSRKLLTRYFVGLVADLVIMMTLLSTGMSIFGIKNALLLGVMGGFLNIIPYLGPLIGATLAAVITYMNALSGGYSPELIWLVIKVVGVFSVSNLIDNIVLQPLIYSNSVKAHPLEIFIVILMAGNIAGVVGMIFAIPAYTLMRIIAKEFVIHSKFFLKITQNI